MSDKEPWPGAMQWEQVSEAAKAALESLKVTAEELVKEWDLEELEEPLMHCYETLKFIERRAQVKLDDL